MSSSNMETSLSQASSPPSMNQNISLFSLSDELLLAIIQNLDRHTDVPNTRLTCRKLNSLTETYFFRNVMLTLSENIDEDKWRRKLRLMPPQISKTRQFTILNQRRHPTSGQMHSGTICRPGSYRILRWTDLHSVAEDANQEFSKAACLYGVEFYHKLGKFARKQLTAFRWRHAIPLSIENFTSIVERQAKTLQELEISMMKPPSADAVRKFQHMIKHKIFPKLRSFKYHGLSHTEPLLVNRPERGGRFRMLRPLFNKIYPVLEELLLSQDHCISQVGHTPMTLGRTIYDTHCRLDDLYVDLSRLPADDQHPIILNLTKLELGGFTVGNIFDTPTPDPITSLVRIHLPALRRLVLNNCFGIGALLVKLLARKDEIKLTEFAVRTSEDDEVSGDLSYIYQCLRDFLLCFKGLEILSVLVEGPAADLRIGKDVLTHHASTLRAYSVAARDDADGDNDETTLRFVAISNDGLESKDEVGPGCLKVPIALREYGTFLNKIVGGEYARLRQLSQFPDLRTVVIRNFPPLSPDLKVLKSQQFWRSEHIHHGVPATIISVIEAFAEQIALPFYALPESYYASKLDADTVLTMAGDDEESFDSHQEDKRIVSELEEIAAVHTTVRDKILGFELKSPPSSPTPKSDLTRDVLKQKAVADPGFMDVMLKIADGTSTLYENHVFENYQELVQVALGVKPPPEESKPKLSLIVVGDWTYRDQMNLSGPRHWDPTAWSTGEVRDTTSDDEYASEHEHDSDFGGPARWSWNYKTYSFQPDFKREFDVALLPQFFKIDWEVKPEKGKGRFRWKPKVTKLKRDTLEGLGALGDVKLLDFAWRM